MLLRPAIAALLFFATATAGMAACPSVVTGNTADAIAANGNRLLCLQQELAEDTARRKYEFDLKSLEQSLQMQQLQRRFDALPTFTTPRPFAL